MNGSDEHGAQGLSRRRFIERLGLTAAAGSVAGEFTLPRLAWGEENSGPVDCGPPPKAAPKRSGRPPRLP
jgi:hypothetical protein